MSTRNPHAGIPFTTSDAEIRTALADVSIPTLLLSCLHMSGDASLLEGPLRPAGLFLNEVQGYMSPEDQEQARELAFTIIRDYRDSGCPEPAPLDRELVHRMMSWVACEEVPPEYVPMMLEELELDGADPRSATGTSAERQIRAEYPVVVIGCGQSGLLAAIRLQEAGFPYVVLEKNAGVGGTWWENTYPGARVDVGNHFYCYSFEPRDDWSEFFARQPELQQYFTDVMDKHRITEHVQFSTTVEGARWDESSNRWIVTATGPDGASFDIEARSVISAVGQLNMPYVPDFEGIENFAGPAFHTARWDHDVDLTGKNVVMIGAGATGFQVAPTIAEQVGHLTVVQRSAQWMFPNPNYHEAVGPGVQWALRHLPFYGRWYRFLLFWPGCDKGLEAAKVDPDWPDKSHSVSAISEFTREMFTDWIVGQLEGHPELIEKVVPTYPPTGKRTLQDNGSWLKALTRDNVELVRSGIERIEQDAVVTTDGVRHRADVIVFATGFRITEVLTPLQITGRGGIDLRARWGERPAAYLGITVPDFPNFFLMYGPGTHLAHGGSLIFASECEMSYILGCLRELAAKGLDRIEPLPDKLDDWLRRTQAEMSTMVWAQPTVEHSAFKNSDGDIYTVSPWRLVDYWSWTRQPDLADFVLD